jgi:hypothetical protein
MLTVASLLAAMTIAGAFWVGVLAARRLRDWGEGRRALEEGVQPPLAIAAVSSSPPDDARTRRIRELVAQRLSHARPSPADAAPRPGPRDDPDADDLDLSSLRSGDVVVVETADDHIDGDYLVEGIVLLREGTQTTNVVNMADGHQRRWLIGSGQSDEWMIVEPVTGHGISGEPPRNIRRERGDYGLRRRGQASAAATGRHGRPDAPRAATYLYAGTGRSVLWLERWGEEVLVAEGRTLDPADVSFLPGS